LTQSPDISTALAHYEASRKPAVAKFLSAANASADWYDRFPVHMQAKPIDFAYSYVTRSGRVDLERLRRTSPEFVAAYEARTSTPAPRL
jgi:hypothetical protein